MVDKRRWIMLCMLGGVHVAQADSNSGGRGGGAAPPTLLSSGQKQQLSKILARYRVDALTADDARALLQALQSSGIRPGPALDRELLARGLTMKQLAALAGPTAPPPSTMPASSTPSGRKVPRPQ